MKEKRLVVSLPAQDVGLLTQDRSGLIRWSPDTGWERLGQRPRLGLDFLRTLGPRQHSSELPCWFENLLPERESLLRARLSGAYGLREGQSFELLRMLGHDLTGAVEVRAGGDFGEDRATPVVADNNDHDDQDGELASRSPSTLVRFSALAGMQLKFSMSMVNQRLAISARSRDSLWIVKLAGTTYEELAEVETATMTWAKHAGFDVPEHLTVPFEDLDGIPAGWAEGTTPAFAIRRFDRRPDGSKIHQEDLCQALGLSPRDKYGDQGPSVTLEGALRLVDDACGERDGREMARRIGFMIASGNTDAHLKNWALLWGDRARPTLAPCYDLVATVAWDKLGWRRPRGPEFALRLGGERFFRRFDDLALATAQKSAGRTWVREEVMAGVERARDAWESAADEAPRRMRTALEEHWTAVPLLARIGLPSPRLVL